MSFNTKIVVIKLKELIITGILALLAIILLILFIIHITTKNPGDKNDELKEMFNPGVYTASVLLSGNTMDIEVCVDKSQVKSIRLINNAEAIETMYPLITSSLSEIEAQVKATSQTKDITYRPEAKYASMVLIKAIDTALDKARISN